MRAALMYGAGDVRVGNVADPSLKEPPSFLTETITGTGARGATMKLTPRCPSRSRVSRCPPRRRGTGPRPTPR
ncbi:hypothetical protein GCM10023195_00630 [Actinoallomurus liliacearum]|uniref:Uncharacterized protein n=1 Tax=Actinoallomurus liliacearum TaxID=1080073 RepID=A0ABP8T8I0_9ACTN